MEHAEIETCISELEDMIHDIKVAETAEEFEAVSEASRVFTEKWDANEVGKHATEEQMHRLSSLYVQFLLIEMLGGVYE